MKALKHFNFFFLILSTALLAKDPAIVTNAERTDGFGAQFQTLIYSAIYAELHNKQFKYTPFKTMEHNYDNDPNFLEKKESFINFINHFEINRDPVVQSQFSTEEFIDFFERNIPACENSQSLNQIKKLFRENKNKVDYFSNQNFNIAIHVRRVNSQDNRVQGSDIPDAYYLRIIDMLRTVHSAEKPLFHIYSQGNKKAFQRSYKGDDIVFHINDSIENTFASMVFADALVTSMSSLSYTAALLSDGKIYYIPFWHPPLTGWRQFTFPSSGPYATVFPHGITNLDAVGQGKLSAKYLEEALLKEPYNYRIVNLLAQAYCNANEPDLALKTFEKRSQMGGPFQEKFWAYYCMGHLQEVLQKNSESIVESYTAAFNLWKCRVEPLFRLSSHYLNKKNFLLAYLTAESALSAPKPEAAYSLPESEMIRDYGLLWNFAQAAFGLKKYDEASAAYEKILAKTTVPPHFKEAAKMQIKLAPHPINYSIPSCKVVSKIPKKDRDFAFITPEDRSTYIYERESDYYADYQRSYYAITMKKAGWDALRHYEILANGCIPYFLDLDLCDPQTLYFFPKELIREAMNLEGVSKGHIDHKKFNKKKYNELLNKLLQYTRDYLTSEKMAAYLLKTLNYSGKGKILVLSQNLEPEYLRDLILIGLKGTWKDRIVDFPKMEHIYESFSEDQNIFYGRGMTTTRVVPDLKVDRENIEQRIKNKEFDLIIYGETHKGPFPYYDLVRSCYHEDNIAYIYCEEELFGNFQTFNLPNLFIREYHLHTGNLGKFPQRNL